MFPIDPSFRLASVQDYEVNSALFASTLQFGDVFSITSKALALAIHQQSNYFYKPDPNSFESISYFKQVPTFDPPSQVVNFRRVNLNPTIQVNLVTYNGISNASVSVIGSVHSAYLESKVHQVRKFDRPPTQPIHRKED